MVKVLLTRSDIANILGIAEASIPQRVIDWAKKEVENMLGKKYDVVEGATYDFILREDRQAYLLLPQMNITEITSVTYKGLGTTDTTEYTITSTDYYIEADTGMIYFNYLLWKNYIYTVTYNYGGDTIVDLDRQLQFLVVFKYLIQYKSNLFVGDRDVVSEKLGDHSIKYNIGVIKSKPELIDKDIEELKQLAGAGDNFYMGTV